MTAEQRKGKSQYEAKRQGDRPYSKSLAWIDLIRLARHLKVDWNAKNRKFILQRGQFYCRKSDLANRWGWLDNKVRRFFKKLEGEGKINQELFHGVGAIITIINFDDAIAEFMRDF